MALAKNVKVARWVAFCPISVTPWLRTHAVRASALKEQTYHLSHPHRIDETLCAYGGPRDHHMVVNISARVHAKLLVNVTLDLESIAAGRITIPRDEVIEAMKEMLDIKILVTEPTIRVLPWQTKGAASS